MQVVINKCLINLEKKLVKSHLISLLQLAKYGARLYKLRYVIM